MKIYSFRIKAKIAPVVCIDIDNPVWHIRMPNKKYCIIFRSADKETPINKSDTFIIEADNFSTYDDAYNEGLDMQYLLSISFAHLGVAIDFGDRSIGKGGFEYLTEKSMDELFDYLKSAQLFDKEKADTINYDIHGLMVYETKSNPAFVSICPKYLLPFSKDKIENVLFNALEKTTDLYKSNEAKYRNILVYNFYSLSFFVKSMDVRFLLLMMAFECYIETKTKPRSKNAIKHIEHLRTETEKSNKLSDEEKKSLGNALDNLKFHSFRSIGREIFKTLPESDSFNIRSKDFFDHCYKIRNKLIHGHYPQPNVKEVAKVAKGLELIVSELISRSLFISTEQG